MNNKQRRAFVCIAVVLAGFAAGASPAKGSPPIMLATAALQKDTTPDKSQSDLDLAKMYIAREDFDQALKIGERLIEANPADATGHNVQGVAYLGKKDLAAARKSFETALRVHPGDVPSLMSLAQIDLQQKNVTSARNRYQELLAKNPRFAPAMIGMANVESANGKDDETLQWLQKAKAADGRASAPRVALGSYYMRKKNNKLALNELIEGQSMHPDDPALLNALGEAQAANGQTANSVATFRRLVLIRPEAESYYRLATALVTYKKYPAAVENLRKAVQLKPDYFEAAVALARLEARAGRSDEAFLVAKQLQKAAPQSAWGLALEGDLLMDKKAYGDAAKSYQKAMEIQQIDLLAIKLHNAETKNGNAKDADAKLKQWLTDHPEDIIVLEYSASQNLKSGQTKVAIEQFERVLQKAPENILALNNLAVLYQREHDPRAIEMAERAYKLVPGSPTVADTLGWILLEQGKTERGLELIRQAAKAAPANTEIRYHLAVALAKSGNKTQSKEELKALLARDKKFAQREAAEALLKQL